MNEEEDIQMSKEDIKGGNEQRSKTMNEEEDSQMSKGRCKKRQ